MIARNSTGYELTKALEIINQKYNNNVIFNREPENISSNSVRFTLKVKNSSEIGARRGFIPRGRKMTSACWHVHGDFFEALLSINPKAVIKAGPKTIDINGGNWQDWNIGSIMQPMYYSEACEC